MLATEKKQQKFLEDEDALKKYILSVVNFKIKTDPIQPATVTASKNYNRKFYHTNTQDKYRYPQTTHV